MSDKLNIAILILAAGESKRMGTPKQLLKWKNTTLLGHTIQVSETLNLKTFVVLGANFEEIKNSISSRSIQILNHENWKNGLGSSIAFGVDYIFKNELDIEAILIVLADQPLINSEYLNSMISVFEKGKNQIIASSYKDGKKGVPVLFDKIYFKELAQLSNDKGAKRLIEKYTDKVVLLNAESMVSDIDTLEDYNGLYQANHQ
ncbi:MAG TPA: nucleotidyltransferase family protein [Flavobacteriaceae bacterium]|nr:nucleotidyltransferase family protein [Flavobacteriaceae bacterium]